MFIATLIAPDTLSEDNVSHVEEVLRTAGASIVTRNWIEEGVACDIEYEAASSLKSWVDGTYSGFDVVIQPKQGRRKQMLVADMDSTMITIECIDELADYAGIKPQIADITERAMRGELDFEGALDARVALLKGLDVGVIDRCHAERVVIMAGARELVRTMRANGADCYLVSGGFTVFADRVAEEIGFTSALSNTLEFDDGKLSGTVARPIIGAAAKRETLLAEAQAHGLSPAQCLAVGDGANDIPMIEVAGLGVAYRAKPKTAAAAGARIDHGDLTALLYAQGYARKDWVV
ncbi:phosphoserine phosphatase SerB [Rhizorhabdus dicambivorans]|uniref:Phosphoserine phosphatase n=1 Tax=Rhizorhabdus dicambivorans TaxID=1850238 RepID=A0A2A4G1D4_9SPHN|nr:phosphoserine phosphatase SerB [Rhizorhabdus dicambivorans]ATE65025.1 phosphoserine phosphatase SerB [Rhizorhabdus dicambivorans]PCE44299.1 phosphoserine phosphatase SerB [Rhizorhabdus dicambivorans]